MSNSWLPQMPWDASDPNARDDNVNPFQAVLNQAQGGLAGLFTPLGGGGPGPEATGGERVDTVNSTSGYNAPDPKAHAKPHPASFAQISAAQPEVHDEEKKKWADSDQMAKSWSGHADQNSGNHRGGNHSPNRAHYQSFAVKEANGTKESYRSFIKRQNPDAQGSFHSQGSSSAESSSGSPVNRNSGSPVNRNSNPLLQNLRMPTNLRQAPQHNGSAASLENFVEPSNPQEVDAMAFQLQQKADKLNDKYSKLSKQAETVRAQIAGKAHPCFDKTYRSTDALQAEVSRVTVEAEDQENMARREYQLANRALQDFRIKHRTQSQ